MLREISWLLEEKYHGEKSAGFFTDCERLNAGEPLAYIIGYVPFLNCRIYLDSRPLIPRPETEFWAERAIIEISRYRSENTSILDLCTGSGAVGVAVAKAIPKSFVTFAEIDINHYPTIEKNILENCTLKTLDTEQRYRIVTCDLFDEISGKFDFILANPPYIDVAANTVEKSVVENEPHLALFGGTAGMEIVSKIITEAPDFLNFGGQLWIEHEPTQSRAIYNLSVSLGFSTTTYLDQYGIERYSVLVLK